MAERVPFATKNTFPGLNEARPEIACSATYDWGSLQVTAAAVEAYGLEINTDAISRPAESARLHKNLRYKADILIASPQEAAVESDPDALMFGYREHRSGVRATLGSNIDKDIAGVDLASKLISAMAAELPEEDQPEFLMESGLEIQDAVKDGVDLLFPHGFAYVASKVIESSFEKWASRQAARSATGAINRASALALIGTGVINGADWMGDRSIEGSTALFSLGYVGFLALKSRSEIRHTLQMTPAVMVAGRQIARSVSREAERDVHNLLCIHSKN